MEVKMEMIRDANGQVSSMRVMSLLLVTLPTLVWALTCVRNNQMLPMPQELLEMIGIGIAGKLIQKPFEKAKL